MGEDVKPTKLEKGIDPPTTSFVELRLDSSYSENVQFSDPCAHCGNKKRHCLTPNDLPRKKILISHSFPKDRFSSLIPDIPPAINPNPTPRRTMSESLQPLHSNTILPTPLASQPTPEKKETAMPPPPRPNSCSRSNSGQIPEMAPTPSGLFGRTSTVTFASPVIPNTPEKSEPAPAPSPLTDSNLPESAARNGLDSSRRLDFSLGSGDKKVALASSLVKNNENKDGALIEEKLILVKREGDTLRIYIKCPCGAAFDICCPRK